MKIVIGSFFILSLSSGLVEELAAAINVYAKIRSEAILPCEWADDSVRWYGIGDHQYSTGTSILQGLPISLRQRLHIIENNGFNLGIRDIHKDDEGNYKCISDNGTINYILYLIVAPSSISFPSSSDDNVITADANKMFNVTCEADGGFPPPGLSVLLNDTLLSSSETRTLAYAINLTRTDDFTNVTCTANHSELNHPLEIHAMFYLNFPPTQLTMMELPTLFEGKLVNISCISLGSRPQASSEWTIDGDVISNSSEDQSEIIHPTETYRITSILSVEFNRLQNRKELSCRSYNLADTKGISQSRMLEIYYHPEIHVTYKNTTEDDDLRIFTCKPNGNPAVYEYDKWEHFSMHNQFIRQLEGRKTDTGANEVILPVTNVNERYQDSGIYICRAQNDIADRYGNKIQRGFGSFISEGTPAAASENIYSNKGKLRDDTILIAKFVSIPPIIDVFWFKMDDGRDIPIDNSKKYTKVITPAIIEDSFHGKIIHVDGYIISLFIRNLVDTDFLKYNCEVHNRYGNTSLTVELVQTTELGNVHDGGWQTAGIVLITIVGLVIVVPVAVCIYKKRKYYYDFSDNRSRRHTCRDNVEANHQWHDGPSPYSVVNKNEEKVFNVVKSREFADDNEHQHGTNLCHDVDTIGVYAYTDGSCDLAINEYAAPKNEQQPGTNLCHDVDTIGVYAYTDGPCDLAINEYAAPENEQQPDSIELFGEVKDPTNRVPIPLPNERYISEDGHPSEIDNICMEPLHDPPELIPRSQRPLQASLLRSPSFEDNIRMEPLHEEPWPGPLTRSKKPLPSLPPSPSIEDIKDYNPFAEITSIDAEYTQPSESKALNQIPDPFIPEITPSEEKQTIQHATAISRSPPASLTVEDDDLSSGFTSFHGPDSMDRRPSLPRSIQPLLQDILEEEDKSSCDGSSNSNSEHEDQSNAIDNPSYQDDDLSSGFTSFHDDDLSSGFTSFHEKEDKSSCDGSSNSNSEHEDQSNAIDNPSYQEKEDTVSSIHRLSNEETTGTEEVKQPTTNTNKKTGQYYPTFPNKTDDETWIEPAEPIKVLDEGETQPMELSPILDDHNDEKKTDTNSEDKSHETEN